MSKHEYKQHYYASNATNSFFAIYEDAEKTSLEYKIRNLFDTAKIKSFNKNISKEDLFEHSIYIKKSKKDIQLKLKCIIESGIKMIFVKDNLSELKELSNKQLSDRIYVFTNFEKDGRLNFNFHLEARNSKNILEEYKDSEIDFNHPKPSLRFGYSKYKFAVENYNFKIKIDGTIEWLF